MAKCAGHFLNAAGAAEGLQSKQGYFFSHWFVPGTRQMPLTSAGCCF